MSYSPDIIVFPVLLKWARQKGSSKVPKGSEGPNHKFHFIYYYSIGDDFGRSVSYGLWSLLVPVGYNRDPASPMGYSNIKIVPAGLSAVDADNRLRGENQGKGN